MIIGYLEDSEASPFFEYIKEHSDLKATWLAFSSPEDWEASKTDFCFISPKYSSQVLAGFSRQTEEVRASQACDLVARQNGIDWPYNLFSMGFLEIVVAKAPRLDSLATAYVAGPGAMAQSAIVQLIKLGFGKINWILRPSDQNNNIVSHLLGAHFGIQLTVLAEADLTQQPGNGTVLVNTVSVLEDPEFISSLTYFNFLKKGGLIVDIPLFPLEKDLLLEASQVGIHVANGSFVKVHVWNTFCRKFFHGQGQLRDEKDFESFLKTRPTSS